MRRERLLPLLAVLTIGALVAGILMCVVGTLMTGGLMGMKSLFPPSASPTFTFRATATPTPTPTPMSPAGRPAPSVTRTVSAVTYVTESPTPIPTDTPPPPSPTSSPTPGPTATQMPTSTPGPPTASATSTPKPPTASPTHTPESPTASPTSPPEPASPTPTPTYTPSPTTVIITPRPATATFTPIPPTRVTGRVVKDGAPVQAGVTVKLEDETYVVVAMATTDAQGVYTFDNLTASGSGFNVLFAQEWNDQYGTDEVVSWAWLGPLTISSGTTVEPPDFEISLQSFEQTSPPTGASFSASEVSAQNPLTFEWTPYPGGSAYWVDLTAGDDLAIVWQSDLVDATSVAFDGTLDDGSHITADTYWWGVGARKDVGDYELTVYGYLLALVIAP